MRLIIRRKVLILVSFSLGAFLIAAGYKVDLKDFEQGTYKLKSGGELCLEEINPQVDERDFILDSNHYFKLTDAEDSAPQDDCVYRSKNSATNSTLVYEESVTCSGAITQELKEVVTIEPRKIVFRSSDQDLKLDDGNDSLEYSCEWVLAD